MSSEKKPLTIKSALADLIEAAAEKRRAAAHQIALKNDDAEFVYPSYLRIGYAVFEAAQGVSKEFLSPPCSLDSVITSSVVSVSARGGYVYHLDVVEGKEKAAQAQLRRELAKALGVTLEQLINTCSVKVVGCNLIVCEK